MKLKKILLGEGDKNLVFEIGGGNIKTYDPEILESGLNSRYTFFTDGGTEYLIDFRKMERGGMNIEVSFMVPDRKDVWGLTGGDEPVKIINTVLDVWEDYHRKHGDEVDAYILYPEFETGELEKGSEVPKRARVFEKFIKKRFPEARIDCLDKTSMSVEINGDK